MQRPTSEPATTEEFTTFMLTHQNMVFTTAARLVGSDAQAQDIAQEVFLKAYENFGALRVHPAVAAWLRTVATNGALNYLTRWRRRWQLFGDDIPEIPAPDPSPGLLDARRREQAIENALRALPARQRVPLVLYHFEDLSYQEIAQRLGVSLPKVKTDIARGRAALLPLLEPLGMMMEDEA